ncbi:MAG TPA: hypothetical protein VFG55_08350 [Rhodanobacteraceae bacterium]|nr:hypothetical protein [Rhodanobacteraceae bacterium]
MENANYALVLTGTLLPGFSADAVWPALANYFRIEPDKLAERALSRAPLTIKQAGDPDKLRALETGIRAIGADARVLELDERPGLFVLIENVARGPLPYAFVEDLVGHGVWSPTLDVAEVGSSEWKSWNALVPSVPEDAAVAEPAAVEPHAAEPAQPAAAKPEGSGSAPSVAEQQQPALRAGIGERSGAAEREVQPEIGATAIWAPLAADGGRKSATPGTSIHGGFWRRLLARVARRSGES